MTRSKKSNKKPQHSWQFDALGTKWRIDTPIQLDDDIKNQIATRIEVFDKTYSRFREDSLVQRLRTPGEYVFPADVTLLLDVYEKLYAVTDGRMTPLIGSMLEQAGYDAGYSLVSKEIKSIPHFEALGWDGATTLQPVEPIVLDVGAAGKGYLVDIIASILEVAGIKEFTIDASGDIRRRGKQETIGLEHPLNAKKVIGVVNIANKSLCASAVNKRVWNGLHHLFDPATKAPTDTMLATWVIADTALMADALATALFFVPATVLRKNFEFAHVTIDTNGAIDVSPDFEGELFI